MKKILIINAGQSFEHSGGKFNNTITETTLAFLKDQSNVSVKVSVIERGYDADEEVEKFVWADYVVYHTPIWWFQLPYGFKRYIDVVFTAGHKKGIYFSDGRRTVNPDRNYGTGGQLQGRKYMLTTSWNAPKTAFTIPEEFFMGKTVDEGPLFGFHRMNAFVGMTPLKSFHFHDIEKNANVELDMQAYTQHLSQVFSEEFALE